MKSHSSYHSHRNENTLIYALKNFLIFKTLGHKICHNTYNLK